MLNITTFVCCCRLLLLLLTLYCNTDVGKAQICRPAGEWCGDTGFCCGGCCIHNTCINTYKDCKTMENPCYHHPCPGNSECHLYQPNCQGCEIQWLCVFQSKQQQQQDKQEINYYYEMLNDEIVMKSGNQIPISIMWKLYYIIIPFINVILLIW